jgi:hypothetical protein
VFGGPFFDVVDVAEVAGFVAAGRRAPAVEGVQHDPLIGGRDACAAVEIQWPSGGGEVVGADAVVAVSGRGVFEPRGQKGFTGQCPPRGGVFGVVAASAGLGGADL